MRQRSFAQQSFFGLLGFLAASACAGAVGTFFTEKALISVVYTTLNKPAWSPPAWVFGPVWTTLYLCMACAAWLIWKQKRQHPAWHAASTALALWWAQWLVNTLWPVVFYYQPAGFWSFFVCALLFCLVALCVYTFRAVSRVATWLMVPYAAWLMLASLLSCALWIEN